MIIESKTVVITDVHGVDSIKIQTDGTLSTIEVDWNVGTTANVFSPAKLKELIDALTAAYSMATGDQVTPDGQYATWQDIPDSLISVRDKDGELWHRGGLQTWADCFLQCEAGNQYAPFTKAE